MRGYFFPCWRQPLWHRNSFVLMPCSHASKGRKFGCIGVTILAWIVRGATEVFYFMSIQYLLDFWNALPAVAVRCMSAEVEDFLQSSCMQFMNGAQMAGLLAIASNYVYTVVTKFHIDLLQSCIYNIALLAYMTIVLASTLVVTSRRSRLRNFSTRST
jgi:hypothetical protein